MKKLMLIVLWSVLLGSIYAQECANPMAVAQEEMNDLYHKRGVYDDPVFTGISSSMIGWGIVLFAGMGILAGFIKPSKGHTSSSSTPAT